MSWYRSNTRTLSGFLCPPCKDDAATLISHQSNCFSQNSDNVVISICLGLIVTVSGFSFPYFSTVAVEQVYS